MPPPSSIPIDPLLLITALVSVGVAAWLQSRSRDPLSGWRPAALGAATGLLITAWFSPLQTMAAHYLLTAHLVQITLVMGAVPALLLLALPRRTSLRLPGWARRTGLVLVHPVVAIVLINVAFFAWHTSAPFDDAIGNGWVYSAEQISLLAVSLLFWWAVIGPFPEAPQVRLSPWVKLGYILLATLPQTMGGITVALAHHPLYAAYADAPRLFGMSPLFDQQIAGACIALLSKVALFVAFAVVFIRMLNEIPDDNDDDGGRGWDPRHDAPPVGPSGTLAWLERLSHGGDTVPEPVPRRLRERVGGAAARR